jgi:hypothetical protein
MSVEATKRLEKMEAPLLEVRAATVAQIEREGVDFTNGDAPGLRLKGGARRQK